MSDNAFHENAGLRNHRFVSCLQAFALLAVLVVRSWRGAFPRGNDNKIPRFCFGSSKAAF